MRFTELEKFQELKLKVLLNYQKQYPYFQGNWKTFSSQDIQNLIGLIEEKSKHTISEKWIYTHLKPEINSKIPRKDMLNILSEFVGFSGWDEFVFEEKIVLEPIVNSSKRRNWKLLLLLIFVISSLICILVFNKNDVSKTKTIELNNQFTNEKVNSDEVKVFQVDDSVKLELQLNEGKVQVANTDNKKSKLIIQSPFYQPKTVEISQNSTKVVPKIDLKPDDYAMMLKAFMLSDIKDWQTRKEQLNKILSDDLEVIVMLKNDLGAEYFNKTEFSLKLIIPTDNVRKMKIINIEKDTNQKIKFIRITQQ